MYTSLKILDQCDGVVFYGASGIRVVRSRAAAAVTQLHQSIDGGDSDSSLAAILSVS